MLRSTIFIFNYEYLQKNLFKSIFNRSFTCVPELSNYLFKSLNRVGWFVQDPKHATRTPDTDMACHVVPWWQIFIKNAA